MPAVTCGVSRFDLSLQLQRDARHLFVGGVASAPPLGFLRGVTFKVDKCHQAVAAGLGTSCGRQKPLINRFRGSEASIPSPSNPCYTHLDRVSVLCLPSCHSAWGAGDIWHF